MFVYFDEVARRWFVAENVDHCDESGHYGMTTRILGNRDGYKVRDDAYAAMDAVEH